MSTSRVPKVHPLCVIETPEDGFGVYTAPHSDNKDRTEGLH
jgi:hypothetical protein